MSLVPDVGLEVRGDVVSAAIAYVAVGTGSNETASATDLGNRVYKAQPAASNVDIVETGTTGEYEVRIEVTGGTEVAAGTDISEMATYDGDPDSGGRLMAIDAFNAISVGSGHTEQFTMPHDPQR